MDYKKKFGNTELLTEYAYIKRLSKTVHKLGNNFDILSIEMLADIMNYSAWLNETKLTPELVEKLFKRVKKQPRNTMTKYILWVDGFADGDGFILGFDGVEWFTNSCSHIKTLADLARLTAAKPILLA